MAYNMRGSQFYGKGNSSPIRQTKEIKGTSIFGKTPKNFAIDALKNMTGYNAVKSVLDNISGSKTDYSKKTAAPPHEVVHPKATESKMGLMKKKGELKKKGTSESVSEAAAAKVKGNKAKKTLTNKMKTKPPYKKPVGPRAS